MVGYIYFFFILGLFYSYICFCCPHRCGRGRRRPTKFLLFLLLLLPSVWFFLLAFDIGMCVCECVRDRVAIYSACLFYFIVFFRWFYIFECVRIKFLYIKRKCILVNHSKARALFHSFIHSLTVAAPTHTYMYVCALILEYIDVILMYINVCVRGVQPLCIDTFDFELSWNRNRVRSSDVCVCVIDEHLKYMCAHTKLLNVCVRAWQKRQWLWRWWCQTRMWCCCCWFFVYTIKEHILTLSTHNNNMQCN